MPISALLLALAAAVVHATWNLLLSDEKDTHSAAAVAMVVGTVVFAPVSLIGWRLDSAAIPYVASSGALELLYLALLATGYSVAAMSFIYPIARGSAPVLVLLAGVVLLGVGASLPAAVGVVVVAVGIVLVRGLRVSGHPRDLALALSIGVCIASYTLVDKHGITHASSLAYLEVVFGITATAYRRRGVARARRGRPARRRQPVDGVGGLRLLRGVRAHARGAQARAGGIGVRGTRVERRDGHRVPGDHRPRADRGRAARGRDRGGGGNRADLAWLAAV